MKSKSRSVEQIIEDQMRKWQMAKQENGDKEKILPVITVSREPGSGGRILSQTLARRYGLDMFHQEVLHEIAASSKVSTTILETLDERGLSVLEDSISAIVHERHLWPDRYLQHLMKVIGTIGKYGNAVIVGRGANFIIQPKGRLRIRVTAPMDVRIARVANDYGITREDAQRRIIRTESNRQAFIRKYFNADIADPKNYDLIINTEMLTIDTAAECVGRAAGLVENQN
jgi:cytidylate kinase